MKSSRKIILGLLLCNFATAQNIKPPFSVINPWYGNFAQALGYSKKRQKLVHRIINHAIDLLKNNNPKSKKNESIECFLSVKRYFDNIYKLNHQDNSFSLKIYNNNMCQIAKSLIFAQTNLFNLIKDQKRKKTSTEKASLMHLMLEGLMFFLLSRQMKFQRNQINLN